MLNNSIDACSITENADFRMLLTEKLVMDHNRAALIKTPSFQSSGIVFESNQFILIQLDIADIISLHSYRLFSEKRAQPLEQMIQRVIIEFLQEKYTGWPFIQNGESYILANLCSPVFGGDSENSQIQDLSTDCMRAARYLQDEFGIQIQIYISPLIRSLEEMDRGVEILRQCINLELPRQLTQCVITTEDIRQQLLSCNNINRRQHNRLEKQFFSSALVGDFDQTCLSIRQLIDLESGIYAMALSLKSRMCSRIDVLFALLDIPYYMDSFPYLRIHECTRSIKESISLDDLKDNMIRILGDIKIFFSPSSIPAVDRIDEIVKYIQSEFHDPNLSVNLICEKFDISLSYLSRLFKERKGIKLIDFIHWTRVQKSKELLLHSNNTVEQIALYVGYQNALTFSRAFKRFESKTPGAFRGTSKFL